jgi:hypothetical protein
LRVFGHPDAYLLSWFVAVDYWYNRALLAPGADAALYAAAAHAWLTGGDPWQVAQAGTSFAAPPPTLLFYAPFAFLQPWVAIGFWLVADAVALVFVIRRLRLPWWWVLFPPIWEGAIPGNPEPVVLACLLAASPMVASLAPLIKPYAIIPLVGERRWGAVGVTVVLIVASAVLLPWGLFFRDAALVADTLGSQSAGLSAFSVPWLLPVGLIGLAALGTRRAGWLAVPVLWPHTQLHYAITSIPKMTPILAVGFSLPLPGAPAIAVAAQALLERSPMLWRAVDPRAGAATRRPTAPDTRVSKS